MTSHNQAATSVLISRLDDSEVGWMTIQSMFNKTRGLTNAFFRRSETGGEGKNFFDRIQLNNQASIVEVFEIIWHTTTSSTVGIVSLCSGYSESDHAYIPFVFLIDGMRGKGIGSQAIKQLELHAAKTSGALTLTCPSTDLQAVNFWTKNNYVFQGNISVNLNVSDEPVLLQRFTKILTR